MSKSRKKTWLAVIAVPVVLIPLGIAGLWQYMKVTATRLHLDPQAVPSVTQSARLPKWVDAVEQGRQVARAALADQNLPGLSVAVGVAGDIVWAEGFGFADLEKRATVAPETKFRIGTVSPTLTSAAVGLLLEEGRVSLDEPIQTHVPSFPEKQWPVTLRHLMSQMSGIRNDGGDEGPLLAAHCERLVEGLKEFAEPPLLFEPGTKSRFSSYGWILVSAAVEAAAGEPFLAFMQKRVLDPLGLNATRADSLTEPIPHRTAFYFPRFAADPTYGLHDMRDLDYSCYAGASAFLSTPSDLVRFAMAIAGGKLLKPATVQLLQSSQRLTTGQETGYGLGWDLDTATVAGRQTPVVGHDGYVLGGPIASLLTLPEHGVAVAVTSNISYADTPAIALKIAQAFAGQAKSPARK